ncbi:MAG: iron-containing alcohol dehydrogenase, partial [Butyrivibrio sp.]|nr:iron-containing alcohol dehydrogenase [Butyrivibrio sp.]
FPVFSIINPELFFTVPQRQIAAGMMDMMSHTMERYFTNTTHTEYVDRLAETTLKTIMKYGEILFHDRNNYDAWFEFALAGCFSHNGITGMGREQDWANHRIEDEMAATYNITHGEGLSVITPAWMEYVYKKNLPMFVQFARNVMDVDDYVREDEMIAWEGIRRFRTFLERMGLPTKMRQIGIDDSQFVAMANRATGFDTGSPKTVGNFVKLDRDDIVNIYRLANRE